MEPGPLPDALADALGESARLGLLGPGPIEPMVAHALGFVRALRPADRVLDLGSGGGLPGLVVAAALPQADLVLLDASQSRTDVLRRLVGRLGFGDRVEVVTGRAELMARQPSRRASVDAVVSRSFGPASAVAECAVGFLRSGGQLVVSEPPNPPDDRWPAGPLAELGLAKDDGAPPGFASFTLVATPPDRFPRRRLHPLLF